MENVCFICGSKFPCERSPRATRSSSHCMLKAYDNAKPFRQWPFLAHLMLNVPYQLLACAVDRNTFDRKHPHGFDYHREYEHNIWHYLSFIIHLRTKKQTEYTGPESFVAEMLDRQDLSFFPLLRTSSIVFEDQISNEVLLDRVNELSAQLALSQARLEANDDPS